MQIKNCENRKAFQAALEKIAPGDCIRIESFASVAEDAGELLSELVTLRERGGDLVSLEEKIDTRNEEGERFFTLCRALHALKTGKRERRRAGIEKARAEGRYKGRKPIAVDEALFDAAVTRWREGEISARQAMAELGLKPNTFYRRIKEKEEEQMKDYKKAQQEIRAEIKEAARQKRQDLDELKKQVREEVKEVKRAAETPGLHDVQREIRKDRLRAEAEHHDNVRQIKKEVEAEAKAMKKLLEEQTDAQRES